MGATNTLAILQQRRSVREYQDVSTSLDELGQLLWPAQGITHPRGLCTAPSAGALYPLEVDGFVTTAVVAHWDTLFCKVLSRTL